MAQAAHLIASPVYFCPKGHRLPRPNVEGTMHCTGCNQTFHSPEEVLSHGGNVRMQLLELGAIYVDAARIYIHCAGERRPFYAGAFLREAAPIIAERHEAARVYRHGGRDYRIDRIEVQ